MNAQEITTWNRLRALDLDAADAALPFSARLARDNGWSLAFAAQAVDEYRKFCFLAVHAGHPVTPSDEVDQVWHLHLLYSQHYWETLCRDTLEVPLHHGPTRGGAAEGQKYHSWYDNTLASYRRYFGEPPRDLWPAAGERFHEHHDFVRVDRRDVVTLDRALLRRGAIATLIGGSALAVAQALAQTEAAAGPRPGVWLVVAIVALVIVAVVVAAVRGSSARKGKQRAAGAKRAAGTAAGGACAYLGAAALGSDSPKDLDGDGAVGADSGATTDGGGQSGCGASGCSGAGSGCGGGGGS